MQKSKICALLAVLLLLLAGCGITEGANDALEVIGGGVQNTLDKLHNAEYQGGPFENNLESARAYLLAQMQEKYGIKFAVAGEEELENYGAFAGATYTCRVAPLDAPEQVATALVSQSKYQAVRDDYAVYFFKAEAEAQAIRLCREREYVQAYEIALQMPQTAKVWGPADDIEDFLQTSGAFLNMKIYFAAGQSDEEYADLILDFLESIKDLNANVKLGILEAEDEYIFWRIINGLAETPPPLPTKEQIIEDMEIARMM